MAIERLFLRRLNIDPKLVYFHSNNSKKNIRSSQSYCFQALKNLKRNKKKISNNYTCTNKFYAKPDTRFPIKENIWDMGFLGNQL